MSIEHGTPSPERYRELRDPSNDEFSHELTQISADIGDPVAKLRYLRGAIDRSDTFQLRVRYVPYSRARRALFRLHGLGALDVVAEAGGDAVPSQLRATALVARKRAERLVVGGAAAGLLLVPALLAGLVLQLGPGGSSAVVTPAPVAAATAMESPSQVDSGSQRELAPVAESLPEDMLGIAPSTIWLADRGEGWELYSNGLRIETTHTVAGEPRSYRVHHRTRGLLAQVYTRPVGILFHTSESDLWPLSAEYGRELRRSSAGLVRYVRKTQAYHYLIDRFGRVYRIVDDDTRAAHAGHSVWTNDDDVYLDLNGAFLGVSFESRWEGGRTLPITRAQLIAGRNLTNYLRQRYAIAPDMCVTHGLTSISPTRHLIGYHRDWARGFPFEAFGLPDLYARPLPSVALFGFGYDAEFLRAVGRPWSGLTAAEDAFAQAARDDGVTVEQLRQTRRAVYQQWSQDVRTGGSPGDETTIENTVRDGAGQPHS